MIDMKSVGRIIAGHRQAADMTQQQLAAVLNVSHQAVSKWETGSALPDIETMIALSELFGVSMEQILSAGQQEEGREPEAAAEAPDDAEQVEYDAEPMDIDMLVQMAPFMSRALLEKMLLAGTEPISVSKISKLAPFISGDLLETLITQSRVEMDFSTLRRLAPFLKREFVDKLTIAVAKGEKQIKPVAKSLYKTFDEFGKAMDEFGRQIYHGVGRAVRQAASSLDIDDAETARDNAEIRKLVFDKAVAENKWEWLSEHMRQVEEFGDAAELAARAMDAGENELALSIAESLLDVDGKKALAHSAFGACHFELAAALAKRTDQEFVNEICIKLCEIGDYDALDSILEHADADTRDAVLKLAIQSGEWAAIDKLDRFMF